jgi:hypothetical protein
MKQVFITILILQLSFVTIAQHAFELVFGEPDIGEGLWQTVEHDGHYYILGTKAVSPGSDEWTMVFYKLNYSGDFISEAGFPKPDTVYSVIFGIPKSNGNLLCFGTLKHVSNPLRGRHTYVCEINPNLELVWEKWDSIVEVHPHVSHNIRNFVLTPDNEVVIQGVVDTVQTGSNGFIFFAKYDLEGNRLDYKSFINYKDSNQGSLMLNSDSSGFYLFGQLTVEPAYRTWIEFDFAFNYLGSGVLETIYGPYWAPVTAMRLSNGNFITANRFNEVGTNNKGLELRLYNHSKQLLKSTIVHHDKTIRIPERRGMGFIDEVFIWVASFEDIPTGFTGEENIRFFVFDNDINLTGSMTYEGDTRYWLVDLLATSDTGCLVSGVVAEYEGTNLTDNYIKKVRLQDVLTGIQEQERKIGRTVEFWPVPAGETLHVKSSQDSDLLIFNTAGEQVLEHFIKEGYNIITVKVLPPGMYLIAIRQNGIIIESHKIIKQ